MDHLKYMMAPPIVFELSDGKALNRLRDSIPEPCPVLGASYPIFVCVAEKDFDIAINNGEIGDSLQDDRLYWFIGDNRWDELAAFVIKRPWIAPSFTFIGLSVHAPAMMDTIKRIRDRDNIECLTVKKSKKKKIAVIAPRQSTVLGYAMRNIADALIRQDHDVDIIEEASRQDRLTHEWVIHELNRIKPTHILNIYTPLTFEHKGSRCFTWIQDHADFQGKIQDSDKMGFIIGGDILNRYQDCVDYDDQLIVMPMACNPEQFPLLEKLSPSYDISFITHVDSKFNEVGFDIIRTAIKHFEKHGGDDTTAFSHSKAMDIVKKVRSIKPANRSNACRYYIRECERIAHRVYWMLKIVELVKRKNLRLGLFGRGWELMPEFKEYARGKLNSPNMVNAVFRSSKVNLHMNPHINMHQRLLEAGCAGVNIAFPKIKHDDNIAEGGILHYFRDVLLNRFDEKTMEEVLTRDADPNQLKVFRGEVLANDTYDVRAKQMIEAIS